MRRHSPLRTALVALAAALALARPQGATRATGAQLPQLAPPSTAHLAIATSVGSADAAPGKPLVLILDITPRPHISVYAPGATDYLPIALKLTPQPGVLVRQPMYPPAELVFFESLNERVKVYQKPFRIRQDLVLDASPKGQALFRTMKTLTVSGTVDYQACDNLMCFRPASIPVSWTIPLRPS